MERERDENLINDPWRCEHHQKSRIKVDGTYFDALSRIKWAVDHDFVFSDIWLAHAPNDMEHILSLLFNKW